MTDEPDPPRKIYKLGQAKFERVNETAPPIDQTPISDMAANPSPAPAAEPSPNDVHRMLHENRAVEKEAGLDELAPKPRKKSRRKRDYFLLMAVGNAFFGSVILKYGLLNIAGIYAFSGIIFFSVSLTWVMWFIVDDY